MPNQLSVKSARDLGPLFYPNSVKMLGQDAAYSIPIRQNETLWVFGDTIIGTLDETGRRILEGMPCNTGLICRDADAANGLQAYEYLLDQTSVPRQLISLEPDEAPDVYRVWGMHGCHLAGKIYWYFIRIRIDPDGIWPYKFATAGSGLAVSNYPELKFRRLENHGTTLWWGDKAPCMGVAVLPEVESGYIYVYATLYRELKHYCYIARVRPEAIENPAAYEYLCNPAPRWSADAAAAISIMEEMPTELSVSYNAYLSCYLAVHSLETRGKMVGRTAPTPWGPWSAPTVLWTSKVALRNPLVYNGPMVYAGKEHAELARENGRIIYLTCVEFEEYLPRLVEVELG